jgi:hypothetical protein
MQIQFMVAKDNLKDFMVIANSQVELPLWLICDETSSNDQLDGELADLVTEFRNTLSNLMVGIAKRDNELLNQLLSHRI